MKRFKQVIFIFILLTVGSFFNAAFAFCAIGELSQNCPLNDDPHGLRNIYDQPNSNNQAAAQAEAQRQRQIRKQEEQDLIARYKKTPFYGAIVMNKEFRMKFKAGERTEEEAAKKALQSYPAGEAQLIATFSNTCAAVSAPKADMNKVIVATARERETALNMAWNQCEAKHGKGQCIMHLEDSAVCSGYDYGEYTKFGFWERFFEG